MQEKHVYVVVGTNWSFDDDVPVAVFSTQEAAAAFAEKKRREEPDHLFYFLVVPFYNTEQMFIVFENDCPVYVFHTEEEAINFVREQNNENPNPDTRTGYFWYVNVPFGPPEAKRAKEIL